MRAMELRAFGGPEQMELTERDRPAPLPTEVLVRVRAAGVNPVDWKSRAGGGMSHLWSCPIVLGWDVSGVVEEIGFGVTLFQPGDEVFGMPCFPHEAGAYAEYLTAPARHFVRKPTTLSHEEAAGLPLAGLTAWQALVDTAEVQPGQRVLVHAAAGGVGHLAVQIAKARGAYVIGTARAAKHEFLRSLGADELIDYTVGDFAADLRDVDLVLDSVGGDNGLRSLSVLRRGGRLVTLTGASADLPAAAERHGVRATSLLVEPDRAGLQGLVTLVEAGRLRVEIATVLPLAEAGTAHELGVGNRTTGKIVLSV